MDPYPELSMNWRFAFENKNILNVARIIWGVYNTTAGIAWSDSLVRQCDSLVRQSDSSVRQSDSSVRQSDSLVGQSDSLVRQFGPTV